MGNILEEYAGVVVAVPVAGCLIGILSAVFLVITGG